MRPIFSLLCFLFVAFGCQQNTKKATFVDLPLATPDWYDPQAIGDTLTVLSWNVEHFVDTFDNPYTNNRREDEASAEVMEARYQGFVDILKRVNADVVVLQEFESASFAQALAQERFAELGYQLFEGHESTNWYMNVVVMSRVPLGTFYSYSPWTLPVEGQTNEDGSAAVQNLVNNRMWTVEVLPKSDYQFALTGLHLKAGRGERNEAWRMGQVNAIRAQLARFKQLNPDWNLLIVGDLNCTPDSPEFQELLANEGSSLQFMDPLAGSGVFSHPADSVFWRIDHILPDVAMLPELVNGSVQPFTPFSPDSMAAIADHLPMVAKFVLKDQ